MRPANLSALFDSWQFTAFKADWYGHAPKSALAFFFSLDAETITFAARGEGSAHFDRGEKIGEYREGLWLHDVAEVFLRDDNDPNRYQEFNLSPSGAWWSHSFRAPRVRDENFSMPAGVECWAMTDDKGWKAAMRIPRRSLAVRFSGGKNSHANICAIAGNPRQQFFSLSTLNAKEPDFHRPLEFLAIIS